MPQVTRQDGHGPPHVTRYSLGAPPAGPSATGHEQEIAVTIASIFGAMVIGSTVIGATVIGSMDMRLRGHRRCVHAISMVIVFRGISGGRG